MYFETVLDKGFIEKCLKTLLLHLRNLIFILFIYLMLIMPKSHVYEDPSGK